MKPTLYKGLLLIVVFATLLSAAAMLSLFPAAQSEITISDLATVLPQNGKAATVQLNNLIFTDRTTHRFAQTTPSWLIGQSYLTDSLENGTTATVTKSGWLYVITPVEQTTNSQVAPLTQQGYTVLTTIDEYALASTIKEKLVVLAKQVTVGETLSFQKWAILVGRVDASYLASEDLALTPPIVLQNPIAAEYQDGNRNWQGMPGLARDEKSGRLWATWYSGGDGEGSDNWSVLYTSADNGVTWKGPVTVVDHTHPVRVYDPNLWIDPNGRMWMIWAQSYTYFDGRCGTWMMYTDNPESENPTWSTPVRVANGIAINDPVVLSNGDWLLPAAIWKKDTVVAGLEKEVNSNVYLSRDEGMTWTYLSSVPAYEGARDCDENMIVELDDGSLRMLIRTKTGIEESFSYDGGKSWTAATDAHLTRVVSKFQIKRLQSGNLLLLYNSPPDNSSTRSHLSAALSTDGGKTWQYQLLLDERYRASYPDVQQAQDGSLYIIYDCLRTKHGRLLLSVITEEDIIAGRLVSEGSFLARLVNDNTAPAVLPPTNEETSAPALDETRPEETTPCQTTSTETARNDATSAATEGFEEFPCDHLTEQETQLQPHPPVKPPSYLTAVAIGIVVSVSVIAVILVWIKRKNGTYR